MRSIPLLSTSHVGPTQCLEKPSSFRLLSSDLTILSVVNSNPMAKTSIRNEVEKLTDFHRELVSSTFLRTQSRWNPALVAELFTDAGLEEN